MRSSSRGRNQRHLFLLIEQEILLCVDFQVKQVGVAGSDFGKGLL